MEKDKGYLVNQSEKKRSLDIKKARKQKHSSELTRGELYGQSKRKEKEINIHVAG